MGNVLAAQLGGGAPQVAQIAVGEEAYSLPFMYHAIPLPMNTAASFLPIISRHGAPFYLLLQLLSVLRKSSPVAQRLPAGVSQR